LKLTHFTQVGRLASAAASRDAPSAATAALLEGSDFSWNNWITAAAAVATAAVVLVQYLVALPWTSVANPINSITSSS